MPIHSFFCHLRWRNLSQGNRNNPAICFFDTILSGFSFEQKTLKSRVPVGVGEEEEHWGLCTWLERELLRGIFVGLARLAPTASDRAGGLCLPRGRQRLRLLLVLPQAAQPLQTALLCQTISQLSFADTHLPATFHTKAEGGNKTRDPTKRNSINQKCKLISKCSKPGFYFG